MNDMDIQDSSAPANLDPEKTYFVYDSNNTVRLLRLRQIEEGRICFNMALFDLLMSKKSVIVDKLRTVHSLAFKGISVYLSGFDPDLPELPLLRRRIKFMFGEIVEDLVEATHVVVQNQTDQVTTTIPTFRADWIYNVFKVCDEMGRNDTSALDQEFMEFQVINQSVPVDVEMDVGSPVSPQHNGSHQIPQQLLDEPSSSNSDVMIIEDSPAASKRSRRSARTDKPHSQGSTQKPNAKTSPRQKAKKSKYIVCK